MRTDNQNKARARRGARTHTPQHKIADILKFENASGMDEKCVFVPERGWLPYCVVSVSFEVLFRLLRMFDGERPNFFHVFHVLVLY